MESTAADRRQDLRYQADERPPQALALGLGFQYAMLAVAGIVLTPATSCSWARQPPSSPSA